MIRPYTSSDFDQILGIYNKVKLDRSYLGSPEYEANIQKNGFLLGLDTPEDIKKEIEQSYLTLVFEQDQKILGYLIAGNNLEQVFMDDEYKTWFNPDIKDKYYHDSKSMTLSVTATDPDVSQKGVAFQLLTTLETKLINENISYLFSIVVSSPITNCPSIIWHTKNGFTRLATSRPKPNMLQLDWYSSILFFKKL